MNHLRAFSFLIAPLFFLLQLQTVKIQSLMSKFQSRDCKLVAAGPNLVHKGVYLACSKFLNFELPTSPNQEMAHKILNFCLFLESWQLSLPWPHGFTWSWLELSRGCPFQTRHAWSRVPQSLPIHFTFALSLQAVGFATPAVKGHSFLLKTENFISPMPRCCPL